MVARQSPDYAYRLGTKGGLWLNAQSRRLKMDYAKRGEEIAEKVNSIEDAVRQDRRLDAIKLIDDLMVDLEEVKDAVRKTKASLKAVK